MKKLPQRPKLSPEEQEFCIEFHQSGVKTAAMDAGWPDDSDMDSGAKVQRATTILGWPRIKAYLAFLDLPAEDQAFSILQTEIATGTPQKSVEAAKTLFTVKAKLGEKAVLDQWIELMMESGAKIVPVGDTREISVQDVFRGSAQIAIPLGRSSGFSNEPERPGTN